MRIYGLVVLVAGVSSTPIAWNAKRDLLGLLEGNISPGQPVAPEAGNGALPPALGNLDEETSARALASASHHRQTSSTKSLDGTPPPTSEETRPSPVPTQHTGSGTKDVHGGNADGTGSASAVNPTASVTTVSAVKNDVSTTPPGELTQWKVIGISIICVAFVAIVIMAITFFDTWSAFVRDILGCGGCRKGRGGGMRDGKEALDLVPDWDRRTWEFKLANEDGHRYPTLTSLDSMTKTQSGEYDHGFHAEQALGRRPSAK